MWPTLQMDRRCRSRVMPTKPPPDRAALRRRRMPATRLAVLFQARPLFETSPALLARPVYRSRISHLVGRSAVIRLG